MLFPEEHAEDLKRWIVKRLENTSDADADVLADYVLALLRHGDDVPAVRKLCETEIPDFLQEDSSVFVNDVFEALKYRSYLPGAPPPPKKPVLTNAPHLNAPQPAQAGPNYDDAPAAQGPPQALAPSAVPSNVSHKRSYNDMDSLGKPGAAGAGGRQPKQPRRGRGRGGGAGGFRGEHMLPGSTMPSSGMGEFDASSAINAMLRMQQQLLAAAPLAGFPMAEQVTNGKGPPKKKARCRDYDRKGACDRGYNCPYEHDNSASYPSVPALMPGTLPPQQAVEEYDPTNALMPNILNIGFPAMPQIPFPVDPKLKANSSKQRGGKNRDRPRKQGGERAPFSAEGPVFDRSRSTIVVENIPEENFSEDQVRDFFSYFGNIVEISMQPYKRLAIVKFDSWDSASAAYQSPQVIFNNRFVKVFWYKDKDGQNAALPPSKSKDGSGAPADKAAASVEIDMEEFKRQQEEKQKAHEQRAQKMEEVTKKSEEVSELKKKLDAKLAEARAMLAAKGVAEGIGSGNGETGSAKPAGKPTSKAELLAALEAEARSLGIDPDAASEDGMSGTWPPSRGGYYSGGRGSYRGRGGYTPRVFRGGMGSYRGGRGNNHAAYAAYSLDNRPKKLLLSGLDFTAPDKDEALRQYLFGVGEFTEIKSTTNSAEITFKDRKTAEQFFNSVCRSGKEIRGLEGHALELAWVGANGAVSSTSTPVASAANDAGTPTDTANPTLSGAQGSGTGRAQQDEEEGEVMESDDKDVEFHLDRPPAHQDQNEMDYEVADDSHWDVE